MSSLFDITKSAFSVISQVWSGARSKSTDQKPAPLIADEPSSIPVEVSAATEGAELGFGDLLGGLDFE